MSDINKNPLQGLYNNIFYGAQASIIGSLIMIIIIMLSGANNADAVTAMIAGYSWLLAAFIVITLFVWIMMSNSSLKMVLLNVAPFLIIILIIIGIIIYLSKFFNIIASGQVSPDYYTYSNLILIVFVIMMFVYIIPALQNINPNLKRILDSCSYSIVMLLSLLNIIFVMINMVKLGLFSTQG